MPKISRSQAEFNFISTLIDEQETLRKKQNKIRRREERKARRSGTGSIIGALLGAFLAPATGGVSIGIGAGIGSRIGSEVGERTVKGSSQIDPDDFLFGIPDIKQRNVEQKILDREFGRGQTMDAIIKGIAAGMFAPEIGRTKDVGKAFFEESKRFGSLREAGRFIGSGELPIGLQKSQDLLGSQIGGLGLNPQLRQFGKTVENVVPTAETLGRGFGLDSTVGGASLSLQQTINPRTQPFVLGGGTTPKRSFLDEAGFDYQKFNPQGGSLREFDKKSQQFLPKKDLTMKGQNQDIIDWLKGKSIEDILLELEKPRGVRALFANDNELLMRMLEEMLGRPKGQKAVQRTQSLLGTQGGFGLTSPSIQTPNFRT